MKNFLLLSTALVALSFGSAQAQVNSTSNATSVSGSQSGASSRAAANSGASTNQQNINFNSPGDTRSTNTNNNNTNSTSRSQEGVNYSGGTTNSTYVTGDQTIRTAPTVYAPPVSGGNPCTLAVSGGVSVIGWGAAAGGTFVDQDCARRQQIAMIHNAGYAGAAKELMCEDKAAYFAFRTAGTPCAYRPAFEGTPVASPQPVQPIAPVAAPTPVQPIAPTIAPRVAGPLPSAQTLRRCRGANDQGPCFSG